MKDLPRAYTQNTKYYYSVGYEDGLDGRPRGASYYPLIHEQTYGVGYREGKLLRLLNGNKTK